ncbi:16S rRNA (uracil(1498)-N(3))-methyltransferase [Bacillaceae bacterium W0354]
MQRYFIDEQFWNNEIVEITGDDRHHIVNVMRMTTGDELIACHPDGYSFQCIIENMSNDSVMCRVVKKLEEQNELPVDIIIAQGLLKGDKVELVIQKGTELGMKQFIPLTMERSVVKWEAKKEAKKIQRYTKIAKEASEQSERSFVPEINSSLSITSLINTIDYDHLLVASEYLVREQNTSTGFKNILQNINQSDRLCIIFGPEGGFSPNEINFLKDQGCHFIRLGKRILRAETAPLYVLSAISFYFEEMEV